MCFRVFDKILKLPKMMMMMIMILMIMINSTMACPTTWPVIENFKPNDLVGEWYDEVIYHNMCVLFLDDENKNVRTVLDEMV